MWTRAKCIKPYNKRTREKKRENEIERDRERERARESNKHNSAESKSVEELRNRRAYFGGINKN